MISVNFKRTNLKKDISTYFEGTHYKVETFYMHEKHTVPLENVTPRQ